MSNNSPKPITSKVPIIPILELPKSTIISGNAENNESNNYILLDIAYELQAIISKINPYLDINQIIISQLKNTILTIYAKINEKKENININTENSYNDIISHTTSGSSTKRSDYYYYKKQCI